ncbi:MAG: lytic transglycosylase domain-containing protein [Stellaceae bacterium]
MAASLPRAAVLAAMLSLPALAVAMAGGRPAATQQLDRVAHAVYGAESSDGTNPAMWRPDPAGPQGPMQVTAKAATDVGSGDRFDPAQNRTIGRAYLAQLYRRYGNWPEAVAAYNWGIGNVDKWIKAGRPADNKALSGVVAYLRRVLRNSGLCSGPAAVRNCGKQFLGAHGAGWWAALATYRGGARSEAATFDRALVRATALARRFGAEQAKLDLKLDFLRP